MKKNSEQINKQNQEALNYHSNPQPGKIGLKITKSLAKKNDFKLAYTPGVAAPCLEIHANEKTAYEYTSKGNSVAVISNGTAVLGLGDIGALASKPVMEGKALLFKYLSGIDAIDVEVNEKDSFKISEIIKAISPTYGGINIEDISAPSCFEVVSILKEKLEIPFFHDDQEGTAIIVAAAVQSALTLVKKDIKNIKIVVSGAGAAAIASAKLLEKLNAQTKNIYMFDSKGLIITNRENLEINKKHFAQESKEISLNEALKDADLFIGLSKGNILNEDDLKNMAKDPIILAMANPEPEIMPDIAKKIRPDAIIGSGRSDFPNQVNNVLCFPFLFRGALDVLANKISFNMQIACCNAIMKIAKEAENFGAINIVPSTFDPILLYEVSESVAKAAIEEGISNKKLPENYYNFLDKMVYEETLKGNAIPELGNKEAFDLIRIMQKHGITKKLNKKLFVLSFEEIMEKASLIDSCTIITKHNEIGYNTNSTIQTNNLTKTLAENEIIGLICKDELLFNSENRIWYANKLCKEIS